MLDTLRSIVQEVNGARNLKQALEIIVRRVKQAMRVDVCSVYLKDVQQQQYVLMATDGLNIGSVGKVRMGLNSGLVGAVASREEPYNLENATQHPQYCYFPETGEEQYRSFLGVPIIHHRNVLGVLVMQRQEAKKFDEDDESFLITIAAQLSGAIVHAEASGGINVLTTDTLHYPRGYIDGLPGTSGVAIGIGVVVYPQADLSAIPDRSITDIAAEEKVFDNAVTAVQTDIKALIVRMEGVLPAEDRALFDAYLLMLKSETLIDGTKEKIRGGNWVSGALRDTIDEHVHVFDSMEDPYLRERAEDIHDLGRRILVHIQKGDRGTFKFPKDTVIVGDVISASMLAEVNHENLVGIVSVRGSNSSHVAILARALNIPAVMGANDLPVGLIDGKELIVDGYRGRVYIAPKPAIRREFEKLVKEEIELTEELKELRDLPAQTPDGVRMPLYVNTGLLADISPAQNSGAEGIGLYRTEFPFMIRERFPGEERQRQTYRDVLESFTPKPVVLRTLDVGGDKSLPYFPIVEDNPFLGWRGIRITLDHPEIFLVQLRAMLRASAGLNNMHLLFPMISCIEEVDEALSLLRRAHHELIDADVTINMPKVGVMIEVPSAIYLIEKIARRVDFLSIGTNDLTQYLLAVDRNNARVAHLFDALHPAVLAALVQCVEGAHETHIPIGVCGEMAGDPAAAILLLGMDVDNLSMSATSLLRIKWVIRNISRKIARELLNKALELEDARSVRRMLDTALEDAGLGGLVRAGK